MPFSLESLDDLSGSGGTIDGSGGTGGRVTGTGGSQAAGNSGKGGAGSSGAAGAGGIAGNSSAGSAGNAGATGNAGAAGSPAETCPVVLSFADAGLTPRAGGDGGTAFEDHCPAGQVIIGVLGYSRDNETYVDRVQAICGRVELTGKDCVLTVSKGDALPMHGITGTEFFQRTCPANSVVTGLGGRSSQYFDAIAIHCTPFTVEKSDSTFTLKAGTSAALPQVGTAGQPFGPYLCPAGQVVAGTFGRSGDWLDAYGFKCADMTIAAKTPE